MFRFHPKLLSNTKNLWTFIHVQLFGFYQKLLSNTKDIRCEQYLSILPSLRTWCIDYIKIFKHLIIKFLMPPLFSLFCYQWLTSPNFEPGGSLSLSGGIDDSELHWFPFPWEELWKSETTAIVSKTWPLCSERYRGCNSVSFRHWCRRTTLGSLGFLLKESSDVLKTMSIFISLSDFKLLWFLLVF